MKNFKIYWIKFKTFLEVLTTKFVYNFNKNIPEVKAKNNVRYIHGGNRYNKLDIMYPKGSTTDSLPMIVYFHGGGWAAYSKDCYRTVCKRLAKMGYVVFNCNYSLTPKYDMPQIISDAVQAILFAIDNAERFGADKNKICLAGDSAGAQITSLISGIVSSGKGEHWFGVSTSEKLKNAIKANLLFYGAFDLNSIVYTGFQDIETYMNAIVDLKQEDSPIVLKKFSPVTYVTEKFPPCLVASGAIDKLHESQSVVMCKLLKASGVRVEKVFFEQTEFRAMHAYIVIDGLKTTETTLSCVEAFLSEIFE